MPERLYLLLFKVAIFKDLFPNERNISGIGNHLLPRPGKVGIKNLEPKRLEFKIKVPLEPKSFVTLGKSASPLQCIWSGTTTDTDPWRVESNRSKESQNIAAVQLGETKKTKDLFKNLNDISLAVVLPVPFTVTGPENIKCHKSAPYHPIMF